MKAIALARLIIVVYLTKVSIIYDSLFCIQHGLFTRSQIKWTREKNYKMLEMEMEQIFTVWILSLSHSNNSSYTLFLL
jgi:hypothetical protein